MYSRGFIQTHRRWSILWQYSLRTLTLKSLFEIILRQEDGTDREKQSFERRKNGRWTVVWEYRDAVRGGPNVVEIMRG